MAMAHIKAHIEGAHYVLMKRTRTRNFANRFLHWGMLYRVGEYYVLIEANNKVPAMVFANMATFENHFKEKLNTTIEII